MYASTVHCSPESGASKSRPMEGRATFTMVTSSPTIRRLMEQISRMPMRRRRLISPMSGGEVVLIAADILMIISSLFFLASGSGKARTSPNDGPASRRAGSATGREQRVRPPLGPVLASYLGTPAAPLPALIGARLRQRGECLGQAGGVARGHGETIAWGGHFVCRAAPVGDHDRKTGRACLQRDHPPRIVPTRQNQRSRRAEDVGSESGCMKSLTVTPGVARRPPSKGPCPTTCSGHGLATLSR